MCLYPADCRDGMAKYARLGVAWPRPRLRKTDRRPSPDGPRGRERDSAQADSYRNGVIHLICDLQKKSALN